MAVSIAVIVIDCTDPAPVAISWMAALGYDVAARNGDWIKLRNPTGAGTALAIDPVPEGKIVKNHAHLDLKPSSTLEAEVALLDGVSPR